MASGRQRHLVTLHLHALHHKLVATAGVSVEACRLGLPHTGASTLPPAAHRYCMATSPGRRWPVQGSAAGSSYAWRTGRPGMQAAGGAAAAVAKHTGSPMFGCPAVVGC